MSPFCICQSCAFCDDCTQELGKWINQECHTCKYYVFVDDFCLKMNAKERDQVDKAWHDAGGKWEGSIAK